MRITCDVHTHSLYSRHAYSTVEENVRAASERGYELLGITDHFSSMLYDQQTIKNFQFFMNTSIWPETWHGVRLLHAPRLILLILRAICLPTILRLTRALMAINSASLIFLASTS